MKSTLFNHGTYGKIYICIFGTFRTINLTDENLIHKVIKPLNADLMFCVSKITEEDESYLDYFKDCNIVDVCIYEDSKYGYENLCEEFSKKLNLGDEWRQYLDIKGNWLGGMQGRKGSGMHLNYNYWKLLERLEYLKTKGFNYHRYQNRLILDGATSTIKFTRSKIYLDTYRRRLLWLQRSSRSL